MKVGVLGTGMVGKAIAGKLVSLGHQVVMGSRSPDNPEASQWAAETGEGAGHGTFAEAAAFGELLFNCTSGMGSLAALSSVEERDLDGKVLVDVANALDFSRGFPPTLAVANTDSLGEQIQRAYPNTRVVKSLNTMNCNIMVAPDQLGGPHQVFISGDDTDAKARVADLLQEFGWPAASIVDLGDITSARGTEMFLPLWLRMMGALGTAEFNIAITR